MTWTFFQRRNHHLLALTALLLFHNAHPMHCYSQQLFAISQMKSSFKAKLHFPHLWRTVFILLHFGFRIFSSAFLSDAIFHSILHSICSFCGWLCAHCELCTVNCALCPLWTVHCELGTVNCEWSAVHCERWIVSCALWTVNCQMYIDNCVPTAQAISHFCAKHTFRALTSFVLS